MAQVDHWYQTLDPGDGSESRTIRAAVYARTSSLKQSQGYSLSEQVRLCVERCELRNWDVAYVFRDEAESGKDTDRPMFRRMRLEAEQKKFDVIVFWKLDRLSRSLIHAVQLEEEFREMNVSLHSITEQLDTTMPAGRFNFRNIASAAEFERDLIQQRTKMGIEAMAAEGRWPNNSPPLGYHVGEDGRLSVDVEEKKLVKWIFTKCIEKRSMPAVVNGLQEREIGTRNGGKWRPRSISEILRNRLYIGEYSVGESEHYFEEYRLIDNDLFYTARKIRRRFVDNAQVRDEMNGNRKQKEISEIFNQYQELLRTID
ncbi:recombinase family protein [Natronorarus salvus]|uniref:recombinase family protein n=1 Tax=Natronorarus salvus TaxID=3117733 RepID=UPI002F26AFC0